MRVLITGGCGFVGSVTAKLFLGRGHDVLIVDDLRDSVASELFSSKMILRRSIERCNAAEIKKFAPDVVLHFAASAAVGFGEADPIGYAKNNVGAFSQFLKTLIKAKARKIIHSGSCTVYGNAESTPIAEDHPVLPVSWYGWTKLLAEKLVTHPTNAFRWIGFRYFNAAGSAYGVVEYRKQEERLIPKALRAGRTGYAVKIHGTDYPTKDGTCVRDYVHVLDIAEAHVKAAEALHHEKLTNEIINLGTGIGSSVKDVLDTIEDVSGLKLRREEGPKRPGDVPVAVASYTKAHKLLGWEPTKNLRQIVEDVVGEAK